MINSLNVILAGFYKRDIEKFMEEINLFKIEENLWRTSGSIKKPAGNLALHIIGGYNYLIGALLANTGFVRSREQEFAQKNVDKKQLLNNLENLIPTITNALKELDLNEAYPIFFDGEIRTNYYVLTQLLSHLNYHLGQVNYLRRMLE